MSITRPKAPILAALIASALAAPAHPTPPEPPSPAAEPARSVQAAPPESPAEPDGGSQTEVTETPPPGAGSTPSAASESTAASPPAAPAEPAAAPETEEPEEPIGDLYDLGAQLFEAFAPEEIKERYRFPTREEWDSFAIRLEEALQSPSLKELAAMETDARAALVALRALPDYAEYADWLEDRLDDISVAQQVATEPPSAASAPAPKTPGPESAETPGKAGSESVAPAVPLYDVWLERIRQRPPPVRAARLVPQLKPVFAEAALPPALVWMAETESSFNPAARSPVGARGLFQLMPGTAKDLGLRLFPFDERLDPLKNASSAARYLARLYARFDDWPLALAAYNAGPTRVARILRKHQASSFAEIADHLPSETRLYVPKVLATITVREGVSPAALSSTDVAAVTR